MSQLHPRHNQRASNEVVASVLFEQLITIQEAKIGGDDSTRPSEEAFKRFFLVARRHLCTLQSQLANTTRVVVADDSTRSATSLLREAEKASEQFFLIARRYYSVEAGGILHAVRSNSNDDSLVVTRRSDRLCPSSTIITSSGSRVKETRTSTEILGETTPADMTPSTPDGDGVRGPTPESASRKSRRQAEPRPRDQRASNDAAASVWIEQLRALQSQLARIIQDATVRLEESVSGDGRDDYPPSNT